MITLVCNAAEASLDIVLGRDEDILCAQSWRAPTRGTEILVPALKDMLARLGLRTQDLGRMACVRGPGSFTGARLVLTTAAAFRRALGIPVAGLDFMQAVALRGQSSASLPQDSNAQIWVLTHARRGLVHFQAFAPGHGAAGTAEHAPQALFPAELCSPEDAARRMGGPGVMLGTGVARNAAAFTGHAVRALAQTQPQAEDLWELALHARYGQTDIEPLYIRPCDAVDVLSTADHARLEALLAVPAGA